MTHSETAVRRLRLDVRSATPEAVAPFGTLVGVPTDRPHRTSAFYQETVRLWQPLVPFQSDEDTVLSVARVLPRTPEVVWMERHFKHTQVFLPLGNKPYAVVLAPPGDGSTPDLARVQALRFDGTQGLQMHIGTWHEFPFAVEDEADLVVILRNETNQNLAVQENDEAVGGDLEKRNVRARLGTVIEVTL